MIAGIAAVSVLVFLLALSRSGVIERSAAALVTARESFAVLGDKALDDRARERAMQQASVRLFASFAVIVGRGALCLGVSLLPILAADATGLASARAVFAFLGRLDVIVVTSVIAIIGYLLWTRLWPST